MALGQIVVSLLDALQRVRQRPLTIIETGTMFVVELEPGETDLSARSTWAITQWIAAGNDSSFYSIDADIQHIVACREKLGLLTRHVQHIKGIGAEQLPQLIEKHNWPDFVLLDADSDADATLREYLEIYPFVETLGGIIVIDDVFKPHAVNKGRAVIALLVEQGRRWYPVGGIAAAIPFGKDAEKICQDYLKATAQH